MDQDIEMERRRTDASERGGRLATLMLRAGRGGEAVASLARLHGVAGADAILLVELTRQACALGRQAVAVEIDRLPHEVARRAMELVLAADEVAPVVTIACDRGARCRGLAADMLWRRLRPRWPTLPPVRHAAADLAHECCACGCPRNLAPRGRPWFDRGDLSLLIGVARDEREIGLLPWLLAAIESPEPDHLDAWLRLRDTAREALRALTNRAGPPLDADELLA